MRWWKLAAIALVGLLTLASVTWAVLWLRPPEPARLVVLVAGYDNTLAVPANPYGKAGARAMATIAKPGGWFGTRSRLNGSTEPARLSRGGLPDLSGIREKCVVVLVASHGGRDRDGAFLFPEDATADPDVRVRVKTLIDQLGKLPARQQKLLILDATEPPAYPDLGLVHNDFSAAVEDLNDQIARVPNLAVFMSTGPDQRSWVNPEWGQSSFVHYLTAGLRGAADANGNKRITGGELVDYVRPRVHNWARDHRGALQTPILLPRGEEGENRIHAMHLAMTDGPPPEEAAPVPFDPPPELEESWREYTALARAYVPPTAYTPHTWRQYEAWILRHEQAIIAGDVEGARNARAKATDLKRQIEAARHISVEPQTLALPGAIAGRHAILTMPVEFLSTIELLAATPPAERAAVWAKARNVPGTEPEQARLTWCRALIDWAAGDPLTRLPSVPALVPLVTEGMTIRPAEINFLVMLARHPPPTDKSEQLGPLLRQLLLLRVWAEQVAGGVSKPEYPFAEFCLPGAIPSLTAADVFRRDAEDLCFSTGDVNWKLALEAVASALGKYSTAESETAKSRRSRTLWHQTTARMPSIEEWVVRDASQPSAPDADKVARQAWFRQFCEQYRQLYTLGTFLAQPPAKDASPVDEEQLRTTLLGREGVLLEQTRELLRTKPEFDASPTPRASVVEWWHKVDAILTAPPAQGIPPEMRTTLVREFRRTSRQLLVLGKTSPLALPEQSAAAAREVAFEAANRRGQFLLARLGGLPGCRELDQHQPGEQLEELHSRFTWFAFEAKGRQSLAEAGTRCGILLGAVTALATKPDDLLEVDRWIRVAPAYAAVSDARIERLRREKVRTVLVEQAKRTYRDHWYGEGDTRYYHTAIERLAADAQKLGLPLQPGDEPFKPYLGPEAVFPVGAMLPPRFVVTDELNPALRVTFVRQPPSGITGQPVFWATPVGKTEIRVPVPIDPGLPLPTLVRPIPKPTTPLPTFPIREGNPIQVTGFFRGRLIAQTVPVDVYQLPNRVAVTVPGLTSTAVAVRADPRIRVKYGFGTGAVAVVLDCSGSLGPVDRKNPKDKGLYPQALKALDALLRELPPGTILTVSVFGQKTPNAKSPEETIREILPPTQLPYDFAPIVEKVKLAVADLEPWDLSPLVRAVIAAKNRIKDEPVPFKAVVLISDGVDTRYADDPRNNHKRSVKDALRAEFPPSGVSLSIVALPVHKSEAAHQAEFTVVADLKPAGKFVTPEHVKELAAWLRSGLNPRVRFSLEPLTGQTTRGDLTAGTEQADNWYPGRLEPGAYRFRVSGASNFSSAIQLERGDRLLLDLTEDRGMLALGRHWFADTAVGVKSGKPTDAWRLSLLQNRSEAGGLKLFATIEPRPDALPPIAVSRVGEAWFEVRPVVPAPMPVSARWLAAPGYPAPSWSILVPGWPPFPGGTAAASPVIEAWWSPDRPFPAAGAFPIAPGMSPIDVKNESVTIGDLKVTIESVTWEDHLVQVTEGGKPESRRCLVVRMAHPPGNPAWVRPQDVSPAGSEIRVYRAANKTTSLFWWSEPPPDLSTLKGFDVVLLNEALRQAKELGHHATLDAVPGPTNASPRPEPVP